MSGIVQNFYNSIFSVASLGPARSSARNVQLKYTALGRQYTQLQQQYAAATQQLSALQSKYNTSQQKNTQLEAQISTLNSQITSLNSQIKSLDTQIATYKSQITGLDSQITGLQSQLSQDKSQIASLQATITNLQDQIKTLDSQITSLKGQITTLQSTIASYKTQIATLITQVATYKNAAARIIASPSRSVGSGDAPLTVAFKNGLAANPLQILGNVASGSSELAASKALSTTQQTTGGGTTGSGGGGITYQNVGYTVSVKETGLPSGTKWGVTDLLSGLNHTSTSDTITWSGTIRLAKGASVPPIPYSVIPLKGFAASPTSGSINNNGSVTITYKITVTATYLWGFGDGSTSTEANPSYVYQNPGTFQPYLTITVIDGQMQHVRTFVLGLISVLASKVSTLVPTEIDISGPQNVCPSSKPTYTVTVKGKTGAVVPNAAIVVYYEVVGVIHGQAAGTTDSSGQVSYTLSGLSAFADLALYVPITIKAYAVKFGTVTTEYGVTLSGIYCL